MEQTYRFQQDELLRYQHVPTFQSGEQYVLVMASLTASGEKKPRDYALRAKRSRDGLEAFPFYETDLRKKKSDKDLYWTVTNEGNGTVSLWSEAARKYLTIDEQGAWLSRKKQLLTLTVNGSTLRFSIRDQKQNDRFLRCSGRNEAESKLVFTSGITNDASSFALLQRVRGISQKPEGEVRLTAGTFADIHIDYGIQLFRPYVRKSAAITAKGYAKRYDLDAVILCGDNISDNGSGSGYPRGGALQGKWPYDRWVRTKKILHEALQKSFRNPENAKNIFYLTGNHEYQVGDRQPEGQCFNSAYYTDLLPNDIRNPLIEKMDVEQGSDQCLLCYEYRVKGIPFLVMNTPIYPKINPHSRIDPAHTMKQALWLEERLNEIEREMGNKAVVFVSSHFPLRWPYFGNTQGLVPSNLDAFVKMEETMNRFPNLFYCFGHTHGGNQHPTFRRTAEVMESNSPVALNLTEENGNLHLNLQDAQERGRFRSDLVQALGYHHVYGGSMSYYYNEYFANDGKKKNSWLTHLEVPFFQACAIEVYDDRVILSMQNFGTKAGVKEYLPNASYKIEPMICLLKK